MSNVISFEDMRKLWKGAGLSGCMRWIFDGQRRHGDFGKKSFGGDYLMPIQNGV